MCAVCVVVCASCTRLNPYAMHFRIRRSADRTQCRRNQIRDTSVWMSAKITLAITMRRQYAHSTLKRKRPNAYDLRQMYSELAPIRYASRLIYLPIYPSIYLSICLSVYLSIYTSSSPSHWPRICLPFFLDHTRACVVLIGRPKDTYSQPNENSSVFLLAERAAGCSRRERRSYTQSLKINFE